ncbi:hypothetical protein ACQGX2_001590 [Campylobacter jejuni]
MIVVAKIFGASFIAFLVYKFGLKKGYFLGCILMSSGIFLSFVDSYSYKIFNRAWFSLCFSLLSAYCTTMV